MSGSEPSEPGLRVLEFYSGLGGLHYAAQKALPSTGRVIEAFDINDCANDVYQHNFKKRPYQGNIEALTCQQLDKYASDMWLLSPPCQPYSRQGHQKQSKDARAGSFITLLGKLPKLKRPPRYLLLENVVGFEVSDTHADMIATLKEVGYVTQGFILSPHQYGYPYSRPRYFCLAKKEGGFALGTTNQAHTTSAPVPTTSDSQGPAADSVENTATHHPTFVDPPYVMLDKARGGQGNLKEVPALCHFLLKRPCPSTDFILEPPAKHTTQGDGIDGNQPQQNTAVTHTGKRSRSQSDPICDVQGPTADTLNMSVDISQGVQGPGHASNSNMAPEAAPVSDVSGHQTSAQHVQGKGVSVPGEHGIFETGGPVGDVDVWKSYIVPERLLAQCGDVLDVVTGQSTRQFMKGTGSVVCMAAEYQDPHLCSREAVQQRAEAAKDQQLQHQNGTELKNSSVSDGPMSHDASQEGSAGAVSTHTAMPEATAVQGTSSVGNQVDSQLGSRTVMEEEEGLGGLKDDIIHPLMPKLDKALMAAEWKRMSLRFVSPREVALLHALPPSFSFPTQTSLKQRYQLLGNSLNVAVVADLISYLLIPA